MIEEKAEVAKEEAFVEDAEFEKYIKEINELNEKLVKKLQSQDGAFSIGVADDELFAVKFGMVNEADVVKNLAGEVQQMGKEIEEASKVIRSAWLLFLIHWGWSLEDISRFKKKIFDVLYSVFLLKKGKSDCR